MASAEEINALLQGDVPTLKSGGVAQVNPLAAIQAGNQAAQSEFQTRQWQAKQAAGQAFLNSIDPATGKPNQEQLLRNLKANPTSALAAQPSAQEGQTLDSGTYQLHSTKLAGVSSSLSELLSRYPGGVPADAAHELIKREVSLGNMTPEMGSQLSGQFGADPHENSKNVTQLLFRNLSNQQILEQTYGDKFRQTGPGGQTIGATQAPARFGGGVSAPPQAGVPMGQSPDSSNQYIVIKKNPDGTEVMGTARQARNLAEGRDLNDDGPHAAGGPGGAGTPPPATLRQPSSGAPVMVPGQPAVINVPGKGNQLAVLDPVTGQLVVRSTTPPVMPPGVRPGGPGPAITPAPGGGVTSGQTSAGAAAQSATGAASATKFQDIVAQGTKARSQDALLATMLGEAQGFRPGPGADLAATIKRTILGAGAQFGTTFGIDTDKLAKQESVVKIGNQLADAQGAGSDARMKVSEGANPSVHNTPAGLDLIIRQLRGNTDYNLARQRLAAAYPDKDKIEDFEAKIASNLDPRVFQYQRMAPGDQRAEYFKTISPADRAAFKRAHKWAEDNGLIGGQ